MPKAPDNAELVKALSKVPLFSGLGEKELRSVAESGREVTFEPGKKILEQGESGIGFLLVLRGKVEVWRDGKKIASIGPGGFFGEMTVLDDRPRSADVVAVEPTTCFGMTSWSFLAKLQTNPTISLALIRELVRRLRQFQESPVD